MGPFVLGNVGMFRNHCLDLIETMKDFAIFSKSSKTETICRRQTANDFKTFLVNLKRKMTLKQCVLYKSIRRTANGFEGIYGPEWVVLTVATASNPKFDSTGDPRQNSSKTIFTTTGLICEMLLSSQLDRGSSFPVCFSISRYCTGGKTLKFRNSGGTLCSPTCLLLQFA